MTFKKQKYSHVRNEIETQIPCTGEEWKAAMKAQQEYAEYWDEEEKQRGKTKKGKGSKEARRQPINQWNIEPLQLKIGPKTFEVTKIENNLITFRWDKDGKTQKGQKEWLKTVSLDSANLRISLIFSWSKSYFDSCPKDCNTGRHSWVNDQFIAKGQLSNLDSPALNHEITRKHYFDGHEVYFVESEDERYSFNEAVRVIRHSYAHSKGIAHVCASYDEYVKKLNAVFQLCEEKIEIGKWADSFKQKMQRASPADVQNDISKWRGALIAYDDKCSNNMQELLHYVGNNIVGTLRGLERGQDNILKDTSTIKSVQGEILNVLLANRVQQTSLKNDRWRRLESGPLKLAKARALPEKFCENLHADLAEKILHAVVEGTTESVGLVGFHGAGGVGKSVLAAWIVRHERVQKTFGDRLVWIEAGQEATKWGIWRKLARCAMGVEWKEDGALHGTRSRGSNKEMGLGVDNSSVSDKEIMEAFEEFFVKEDRPMLIVVDDVWKKGRKGKGVVDWVQEATKHHKHLQLLVTTRNGNCLPKSCQPFDVKRLKESAALELLKAHAGEFREGTEDLRYAKEALGLVGHLPVALKVIGSRARESGWKETRDVLQQENDRYNAVTQKKNDEDIDDLYGEADEIEREEYDDDNKKYVEFAFAAGIKWMPEKMRGLYLLLGAFPVDTEIRMETLEHLWQGVKNVRIVCDEFKTLSLLEIRGEDQDKIWLHNLQHVCVRTEARKVRVLAKEGSAVVTAILVHAAGKVGCNRYLVSVAQETGRIARESALCEFLNGEYMFGQEMLQEIHRNVLKNLEGAGSSGWLRHVVLGKSLAEGMERTVTLLHQLAYCGDDASRRMIKMLAEEYNADVM
eukprot:g2849.t1